MKAITIWQPWSSLIAIGAKKFETRSWATSYRGPIAIHAAVIRPKIKIREMFPMDPWGIYNNSIDKGEFLKNVWRSLFTERITPKEDYGYLDDIESLPLGAIIATAELVNCWRIVYYPGTNIGAESLTNDKHHPDFGKYFVPTEQEMLFGDWTPGRYAWELANVQMLPEPIPAKGKQRLWEWEEII